MAKASQRRIQRLETKLAHERELLDSLEQNQSALYEQLGYISDGAERNNKNRKIASLEKEIEEALARYEETEKQLEALKKGSLPSQPPGVDPPVEPNLNQSVEAPEQMALENERQELEQLRREREQKQQELEQAQLLREQKRQELEQAQLLREQKRQELEQAQHQAELDYQNNLQRYRQEFIKAIEAEYPLHEFARQGLQTFQQQLGLKEPDVAAVEAPLLEEREAIYQREQDVVPPPKIQTFKFGVVSIRSIEKTTQETGLLGLGKPIISFNVNLNRIQKSAEYFSEDLGNGVRLEMVSIPGGPFIMGSPEEELKRSNSEGPQHQVTVPAFFMGKYPVTQMQWQAVAALTQIERKLNPDPSHFKGIDRPVEQVSWLDAVEFCKRLSQATGQEYHLPSESEWEYACRAGTTTPFHFGETITTDLANYDGNYTYNGGPKGEYRKETTPVGNFGVANAFGLYDMHGNVWEWCADQRHVNYEGAPSDGSAWIGDNAYDNYFRLLRGGSWSVSPRNCRSARHYYLTPDDRLANVGLRVACSGS